MFGKNNVIKKDKENFIVIEDGSWGKTIIKTKTDNGFTEIELKKDDIRDLIKELNKHI